MKQPRIYNERLRDQSAAGVDSRQDGRIQTTRFIALLASAVAMSGALAHLFELPHKIGLSAADYLTVQQIYRGWALLGIPVAAALVSTLMLAILVRHSRREYRAAVVAFLCIVGTQIVFWTVTQPANQATDNWSMLPDNWEELRLRWEYSHAASAVLNLAAFIALIVAVLSGGAVPTRPHADALTRTQQTK